MGKYIGDLLMGGFAIIVFVQAINHPDEVVKLVGGLGDAYSRNVNTLATAG